jgi:hypothetical protein
MYDQMKLWHTHLCSCVGVIARLIISNREPCIESIDLLLTDLTLDVSPDEHLVTGTAYPKFIAFSIS